MNHDNTTPETVETPAEESSPRRFNKKKIAIVIGSAAAVAGVVAVGIKMKQRPKTLTEKVADAVKETVEHVKG